MNPPRPNEADEIINQRIDNIRMNIPRDFKARLNEGIDVIDQLAEWIQAGWEKYQDGFGQPVHGTLPQIKAMLELGVRRKLEEFIAETEAVVTKRERISVLKDMIEKVEALESFWLKPEYCDAANRVINLMRMNLAAYESNDAGERKHG